MKTAHSILLLIYLIISLHMVGQEKESKEEFGKTLNVQIGTGYYRYVGYLVPVVHADYEFQIDNDITLAPFISIYNYDNKYFWGDQNNTFRDYNYSETVIPIGTKVSYYLDELIRANKNWDFYLAGSLGLIIRKTTWESEYKGKSQINPGTGPMYFDFHVGSEFHINKSIGLQLDLSTGRSTFGLAFHF